MEPETARSDPGTEVSTSTTTSAPTVTQALEGLKLTPVGIGITTLPLKPRSERRHSASEDDDNWRDRGDSAKVDGKISGAKGNGRSSFGDAGRGSGDNNANSEHLLFKDQRDIGNFMIQREIKMPTTPMPLMVANGVKKLLPKDEIGAFKGRELGILYDKSEKIEDYREFHEMKQTYFYRWLVDHGYFQNIGHGKKWKRPHFLANEGRIVDALLTPMRKPSGWQFYAIKYQDIIFLSAVDAGYRQTSTLESHCGYVYRELITGGNPESDIINEFEKVLAATEATFGDHQLLVVSETDGLDDQGNAVKIRAYKPIIPPAPRWVTKAESTKFLKYWGVSTIPGVKTLVLGHRDKNHILQDTEFISTDDLWERTTFRETGRQRCYTFANRLLNFVKEQFKGNDRFKVKLIKWEGVPRNRNAEKKVDPDVNGKPLAQDKTETSETSETKESSPTEMTEGTKNGGAGYLRRNESREWVPPHPRFDLENASVICTTIVDPDEVKKVSKFMLPDWFVDTAFNEIMK